jgi:hypothetical protein
MRYACDRSQVRATWPVVELSASYDDGTSWLQGLQLLEFREDKVGGNGFM